MITFLNVTLLVLLFFVFLVFSVIVQDEPENIEEGFKSNKEYANFCDSFKNEPNDAKHEKECNKLNKELCSVSECCSYAKFKNEKKEKCVASNEKGEPIYPFSENDNEISYYVFKEKKVQL